MTATERLRALLDERGVEYELYAWSCGASVWWRDGSGTMWRAHDNEEDELLSFYAYNSVTPEQAIAATLGATDAKPTQAESSGTCHPVEQYLDMHSDLTVTVCSSCGVPEDELADMNFCPNCGKRVVEVDE